MVGSLPGVIRQDAISYYNLGEAMDLGKYEVIDWDDEEEQPDERLNNLLHCLRHGVDERVVAEVLSEEPVEIRLATQMAEGAFVGPDRARSHMWTLLFDTSYKRGDWLRPVTGWRAKPAEIREWERVKRRRWRGRR
jgi:hypothetical protein